MKKSKRKHPKGASNARWICAQCGTPFNDYWEFEEHTKKHSSQTNENEEKPSGPG